MQPTRQCTDSTDNIMRHRVCSYDSIVYIMRHRVCLYMLAPSHVLEILPTMSVGTLF